MPQITFYVSNKDYYLINQIKEKKGNISKTIIDALENVNNRQGNFSIATEHFSEYLKYYDDWQLKEIARICQEEIGRREMVNNV